MTFPTAVIAEDEPLLRTEIREALKKLWPDLVICAEVGNGIQALQAMHQFTPQVLFLDIQMPELSGLDVARQAAGKAQVVFITANDQHAIEAFERGAIDYVQKPISMARLSIAIDRVQQRLASRSEPVDVATVLRELAGRSSGYLKWLTVPHANEVRLIMTEEICYLQADNKYTSVFTASTEFLLSSTLKQVREKLDPQLFWQVHRSTVVNLGAVHSAHRSFRGAVELKLKQRPELLAVSAQYAHLFKHL
jgi:DNA-binding LytR/AlgR family response regulator